MNASKYVGTVFVSAVSTSIVLSVMGAISEQFITKHMTAIKEVLAPAPSQVVSYSAREI